MSKYLRIQLVDGVTVKAHLVQALPIPKRSWKALRKEIERIAIGELGNTFPLRGSGRANPAGRKGTPAWPRILSQSRPHRTLRPKPGPSPASRLRPAGRGGKP